MRSETGSACERTRLENGGKLRRNRWGYTVAAVSVLGVSLSAAGLVTARRWEDHYARTDFALHSENRISVIRHEIESNLSALNTIRGFAEVPGALTPGNFESFAARILESHPSLRAVEWLDYITDAQRGAFEQRLRREGAPQPFLSEGQPGGARHAGRRPEYFPVRFLYPRNPANASAIGFDFGSCKSCVHAINVASATGSPAATLKFKILEHTGDGYAVAVLLPVRDRGQAGAPLRGFAMVLLQVADVVERAVRHLNEEGINIQMYDQDVGPGNRLLYFHTSRRGSADRPLPEGALTRPDGFEYASTLKIGGRQWLAVCTPTFEYIQAGRTWRPWYILGGGLLLTCAVATLFLLHLFHTSRVEGANRLLNEQIQVRLQTERELAAARDQALAASRTKSQFLATMSHEIRTPMNGVIGMTHLLLDTPLTADQREYAGSVQRSAEALLHVINDILDLSRIEAGRLVIQCSAFDLRRTIEDVAQALAPKAREKDVALTIQYPANLPTYFLADEIRIRQVLMNLVGNAVKFTPSGGVSIRVQCGERRPAAGPCVDPQSPGVTCRTGREEVAMRISVRDTGIGIPPDKLGLLFEKFSQVDGSDARQYGGAGLGLAISKELVELLGGEIGVESVPLQGSTFWFTLPLPIASTSAAPPVEPAHQLPWAKTGVAPRILVAEDNPINLRVATVMLERIGLRADVAINGEEVVQLFEAHPYDVILIDCQMPQMDGYAATAEIRKRQDPNRAPVIIAMTAAAMEGTRERCLAAGMDDYVAKPVTPAILAEVLKRWDWGVRRGLTAVANGAH
jgi:signal transduction histidine kinase/ActR/RegA family two-component response regulator